MYRREAQAKSRSPELAVRPEVESHGHAQLQKLQSASTPAWASSFQQWELYASL